MAIGFNFNHRWWQCMASAISALVRPARPKSLTYLNKSYSGDLHFSLNLYGSFRRFYRGQSGFVISVPSDDLASFQNSFAIYGDDQTAGRLRIISDQDVFASAKLPLDSFAQQGWMQQQVIKLCFCDYCETETYVTLDSDNEITRLFDDREFFHGGQIKTLCKAVKLEERDYPILREFFPGDFSRKSFIDGYGLFDVFMMRGLRDYLAIRGLDFSLAIDRLGLEMQWYGAYVYTVHREKFFPTKDHFMMIWGCVEKNQAQLRPILEIKSDIADYFPWRWRAPIGFNIHYPAGHRGKTLSEIYSDS